VPTGRAPSGARGHLDLGLKGLVQTGFDLKSLFNSNGFRPRQKPDWPAYWQPWAQGKKVLAVILVVAFLWDLVVLVTCLMMGFFVTEVLPKVGVGFLGWAVRREAMVDCVYTSVCVSRVLVDWGTYSVADVMDRCLFSCKLVLRKSLPISCWEFKTSDGGGSLAWVCSWKDGVESTTTRCIYRPRCSVNSRAQGRSTSIESRGAIQPGSTLISTNSHLTTERRVR
jgi:hypothetical protein